MPPGMQEKKLIPFSTSGTWNTHCVPGTSTSWLLKGAHKELKGYKGLPQDLWGWYDFWNIPQIC